MRWDFNKDCNKGGDYNKVLEELEKLQHYKSQGRPKYSIMVIKLSILFRYTSSHTYKLIMQQLPLPSLSYWKE